jgi:hypothetical protein
MRFRGWKKYGVGAGGMLVLVMAILLATGWGSAVAAQIQNVFVTNDAAHAVPVLEQGTPNVNVTNTTLAVHDQVATQLLATGTVSDTNTSLPDIDVSPYKEIRIAASFIACNPSGGSGNLVIGAKEGGNEYDIDSIDLCGNFPTGFHDVYEVPGRTLTLHCASCTNVAIGLAVFGRTN